MSKTIIIPLLGKGATNHLHRQVIVDEFKKADVGVMFLVRDNYFDVIKKLAGCSYRSYTVPEISGWKKKLLQLCESVRYQNPTSDPWRIWRYETILEMTPKLTGRMFQRFQKIIADSRFLLDAIIRLEKCIYDAVGYYDLDGVSADMLLVMGVGTSADLPSCRLAWWARKKGMRMFNVIGNYDGLCSKGFRGFTVDDVLVWGNCMKKDAIELHCVEESKVHPIGALKYNMMNEVRILNRQEFFNKCGLDPDARTIVFAGSAYNFQYFEMIAAYDEMKKESKEKTQLIIRVYPNRDLLRSSYLHVLEDYVRHRKDIWISIGDPEHGRKTNDEEVLQIDEDELWNILTHCDVVVNIFSTLTLEACIFDKPVINMWYFHPEPRALRQTIYNPYPLTLHVRRVMQTGAAVQADDRKDLIRCMMESLAAPGVRKAERALLVKEECGDLSGMAVKRLVEVCVNVADNNAR